MAASTVPSILGIGKIVKSFEISAWYSVLLSVNRVGNSSGFKRALSNDVFLSFEVRTLCSLSPWSTILSMTSDVHDDGGVDWKRRMAQRHTATDCWPGNIAPRTWN